MNLSATQSVATSETVPCPVCGRPSSRSIPADIALFLRIKCDIEPDVQGKSHYCAHCEHVFFTPFLTETQLGKLYAGYRGSLYNQLRLAVEPGYAYHAAQFADPNSDHDNARRDFYDKVFPKTEPPKKVIDFGGGDGRFSRHVFPSAEIIIVEEDFERNGGNLAEVLGEADFFFCAHVAEHLPQPYRVLSPLISALPGGCRVWIEVPQEYPDSTTATYDRLASGSEEISSLRIMHEHIAHFSLSSLTKLTERLGLRPLETASLHAINGVLCEKPGEPLPQIAATPKGFLRSFWPGRRQTG